LLVSCPWSSWKWKYLDMSRDRLLPNIQGGCSKLLAAFSVRQVNGLHYEYGRLLLEERKWANYEQTLSLLRAKVEGLKSEREILKASEIQVLQEIDSLRQDRAIVHGKCTAFEEVAKLKEPFVLEKMPDYHTSLKDEYDRAGEDMANASYPFLSEFTSNPYAYVEQLLSMKPRSLRSLKAP
nr:hypothetical protein [Tanacetum cinerariifolium]